MMGENLEKINGNATVERIRCTEENGRQGRVAKVY
jgi:hypothetical protein